MKKNIIYLLLFFLYFGGDLHYIPLSIASGRPDFSMSSLEDGIKFLENLPRAYSIVIFFAFMSFLYLWVTKKIGILSFIIALVAGILIGFKVYTGIFVYVGLFSLALYFGYKKDFTKVIFIGLSVVLGLMVYLPVNSSAGGLYYVGFWRFENLIAQPQLGLIRYELAREIFKANNNWPRLLMYSAGYFVFYLIVVFGTKLIAIVQSRASIKLFPKEIHIFLIPAIFSSAILGFFFNQTSGGSNTFNFLVSVFIIGSLYSAISASYVVEKAGKIGGFIFIVILIALTIPRVLVGFYTNVGNIVEKNGFKVSNAQQEAYLHIKQDTSPEALVLVDKRYFEEDVESPYVSIFTDRPMFLSSNGILISHGIEFKGREKSVKNIFHVKDPKIIANELVHNRINYIIMKNDEILPATEAANFLKTVFHNDEVRILETDFELAKRLIEEN